MTDTDALYLPLERDDATGAEVFSCTSHVMSAWGPIQHGGPVAGLLTRAMERVAPREDARIGRVTVDLLGAVPLSNVRVWAEVLRPGRRIELLGATMEARDPEGAWRPVARAQGWRLATQTTDDVLNQPTPALTLPESDAGLGGLMSAAWQSEGFVSALEWRGARIGRRPGEPSVAWLRLLHPLVAGEETTPVVRALTIADAANGIGARLDPARFSFLNTDLTVQLTHLPEAPWIAISAETVVGPDGVAVSQGTLHDTTGTSVGRLSQTVLVERRTSRPSAVQGQ